MVKLQLRALAAEKYHEETSIYLIADGPYAIQRGDVKEPERSRTKRCSMPLLNSTSHPIAVASSANVAVSFSSLTSLHFPVRARSNYGGE